VLTISDSPLGRFFEQAPRQDYLKLPSLVKSGPGSWDPLSLPIPTDEILALRRSLIMCAVTISERGHEHAVADVDDRARRTVDCVVPDGGDHPIAHGYGRRRVVPAQQRDEFAHWPASSVTPPAGSPTLTA
jgi:hypothetical protein